MRRQCIEDMVAQLRHFVRHPEFPLVDRTSARRLLKKSRMSRCREFSEQLMQELTKVAKRYGNAAPFSQARTWGPALGERVGRRENVIEN